MSVPVRVLVVDDSPDNARLLFEELARGGFDPVLERVTTREELERSLAAGWDVVVSDLTAKGVEAFDALALIKERDIDMPFLLVSEAFGEETAVRAMKAGAQNCIPRGSLPRLCPILERELREAQIRRERRQAQKALTESELRFRTLAETAPDAILTVDAVGTLMFANPAAERLFGYPLAALIGQPVTELVPDYRPRRARPEGEGSQRSGLHAATGRHASGRDIALELAFGELVRDGKRLFTVFARDVAERTRAERALRESEERFRVAAQNTSDLIYEWDIETDALLWFGDIDAALGYGPGEFPRTCKAWEGILHPEDRARVLEEMQRHVETGEPYRYEYRVVLRDGRVRSWTDTGLALRDGSGRAVKWIGANRDITERLQVEAALRDNDQRLRALVRDAPLVLLAYDARGTVTFADGRGLESLGLTPEAVVGRPASEIYPDTSEIRTAIDRSLRGETFSATLPVRGLLFEARFRPHHDGDGSLLGVVGVAIEVTEQVKARRAAEDSERRYRSLFEQNLAGVYRTTQDGRVLDCNEAFAHIFGFDSREEALRQTAWEFYANPEDRKAALSKLNERQSLTNFEICLRRKDGSLVWVLENENLIEGPEGEAVIEGTLIDISDRKRAEEQVKHLAFHDPLTNLPNRLLFNDRLSLAVAQAHRHNQRLAVLFLDLDRFKVINDSLGHSVGDHLLQKVADRIQEHVREGDTVARLGGDEFTLLVPGIQADEDAAKIARKICDAIREPLFLDGRELFVTTSLGVSVYPSDGHDAETLVRNADSAMYRAKEQGRDNYQLYTPAMNARAVEKLALESRLRQALSNQELELHYQPFMDLRTAEIRGAEALLRWRHPDMGLIPPGEFIPLAEMSGLIIPIGDWVLRTACAAAHDWHEKGFPGLSVSVNLSSRQFQQMDLVSQVTAALEDTGLDPGSLDLEITESNAMQNAEHSINTLWGLKRQGVQISMDDFGTGYSSLNYLKRFPIDRIKLDQSFVRDIPGDPDDTAIATAVIAMGKSLELVVVAEGVETEEQLAFLRHHDCDQLQGFLLSRPLPAAAFEKYMIASQGLEARRQRLKFARA